MYIGDYWTINGVNWLIADMDYRYNCGDIAFTRHHLIIVPSDVLYNAKMNESYATEGGYVGSKMYTENLNQAKSIIANAFGDMVLTHRQYLINAVSNGKPSAGSWYDSTVELMNECMVYGHSHFAPACDGTMVPALYTIDKTQLALFALRPSTIFTRSGWYWLRDVVSSTYFADVGNCGDAGYGYASTYGGVRPVFAIG